MTEPRGSSTPGHRRGPSPAGVLSLAVSGLLLAALYRELDVRLVAAALRSADTPWLVLSVGMIAPITVLRALRFFWVAPPGSLPGLAEALRLTLVASALNAFLPAKTGDLIKSYFVATRGGAPTGVAMVVIVYERLCDIAGLVLWCIVGWMVATPLGAGVPTPVWPVLGAVGAASLVLVSSERAAAGSRAVVARVLGTRLPRLRDVADGWPDLLHALRGRRAGIVGFSLCLWLVHLLQIWMFTIALSATVPFAVCASLSALALMAGQVPFTVAGLGARDVVLVALLGGYMPRETAAALGILMLTRGILPPLAALPIMRPYVVAVVDQARAWRVAHSTTA